MTWRRENSICLNFGKWNEIVKSPAKDQAGGKESQVKSGQMLVSLISFGIMVIKSKVSQSMTEIQRTEEKFQQWNNSKRVLLLLSWW